MTSKTIKGSCHCGAVKYRFNDTPDFALKCNCSMCLKLGALWVYSHADNVEIIAKPNVTIAYSYGDKNLAFHSCKTCGCTTHWVKLKGDIAAKKAVNLNLADPQQINQIKQRNFDGADSWKFLD
ncbi:MAG: GFA family protein [Rhizobiales bacterium]|nr:GFA family protein [Hyphomicrobiales bacterium]